MNERPPHLQGSFLSEETQSIVSKSQEDIFDTTSWVAKDFLVENPDQIEDPPGSDHVGLFGTHRRVLVPLRPREHGSTRGSPSEARIVQWIMDSVPYSISYVLALTM